MGNPMTILRTKSEQHHAYLHVAIKKQGVLDLAVQSANSCDQINHVISNQWGYSLVFAIS